MKNKSVLGKGLSVLLSEEIVPIQRQEATYDVDIELIDVKADQPRKHFNSEKIKELSDSIVSHGLVQPIIVNKCSNGRYKIIAGERRYRACKLADIKSMPVIVKKLGEKEMLEVALIENMQRQDLSAIEEAEGLERLIKEYGYNHKDLAASIGKSRSHVANLLRLNQLPDSIKVMINNDQLSMGHARCLIGLDGAEDLAKKIIDKGFNVRQAEELANNIRQSNKPQAAGDKKPNINEDLIMLGQSLSEKFGVKVVVDNSWNGGKISFHYKDLEELDLILTKLE